MTSPNTLDRYSLPADLVQELGNLLNELPAKLSRRLLNALENECAAQEVTAAANNAQDNFQKGAQDGSGQTTPGKKA